METEISPSTHFLIKFLIEEIFQDFCSFVFFVIYLYFNQGRVVYVHYLNKIYFIKQANLNIPST